MRKRGFEWITAYRQAGLALPSRKTIASAGYDIAASEDVILRAGAVTLVPTGLKAYMASDEFLIICIRSGLSVKNSLSLINSQGIIDSDYYNNAENEGHILIAIYNHGDTDFSIAKGTRIAQGIFQNYLSADADDRVQTVRSGGFGSTGNR